MSDDRPFAHVPAVKPEDWERLSVFRETFLSDVLRVDDNQAFRAFGQLQDCYVGEAGDFWPFTYVDATAHALQAVLADLRFLQGFLGFRCDRTDEDREADREQCGGDEEVVKRHDAFCDLGSRLSRQIEVLADEVENAVGGWKFTEL